MDAERRARLFASVLANAKDAVLVTEAEPVDEASGGPRILYVNEAFTAMTGYTADEAVGRTPRMLQSPETDQDELDRLRLALAQWRSVQVELRNVHKDGHEFWVQFIIVPVADEDGWYTHWISIQRDVTERHEHDERTAALVAGSSDVVLLCDLDGRVSSASPAASRTLDDAGRGLVGADVLALLRPEARDAAHAALQALGRPEPPPGSHELEVRTTAGWRWFELSLRLASLDGAAPVAVVTATDCTERRQEQAALHVAQDRLRGAFADAPTGMVVVADDGTLLSVNAQFCELVGRSERQLVGRGIDPLIHPDDRRDSVVDRRDVLSGELSVIRRERRVLHADGHVVGVMFSASVVRREGDASELVVHIEDISERKALEAALTHQAMHDDLTHLPNRGLFLDRLATALERGERNATALSVLFIDLDHFKTINDSFGHEAGDRVLSAVARRLGSLVRPGDTASRFGGDEFAVLCDGADARQAALIATRIAAALDAPVALPELGDVELGASIGVATADGSTPTAEALLRQADTAMYAAKIRPDVGFYAFDAQLAADEGAESTVERRLADAIARDELEVHYQPIGPGLREDDAFEFEALVRWRDPILGLRPPVDFISVAERSGLIVDIDRWVLDRACADAAGLGDGRVRVWVNFAQRTLVEPGFDEHVEACLKRSGLPPAALGLEITERAVVESSDATYRTFERLRGLGVQIAVDDFGTGYSSLAALIERPVDVLKLDRSLIEGVPASASIAIVRAIVAMADALGLRTVAEGVEHAEQLELLVDLGAQHIQGYHLARPMPLAALAERYARYAPVPPG